MLLFHTHAISAPVESGGEIHNISRNRACAQVPPRARKLRAYGSGTSGAFLAFAPAAVRTRGSGLVRGASGLVVWGALRGAICATLARRGQSTYQESAGPAIQSLNFWEIQFVRGKSTPYQQESASDKASEIQILGSWIGRTSSQAASGGSSPWGALLV